MATTYPQRLDEVRRLMGSHKGLTARAHPELDIVEVFDPQLIATTPAAGEKAGLSDLGWTVYAGGDAATYYGV